MTVLLPGTAAQVRPLTVRLWVRPRLYEGKVDGAWWPRSGEVSEIAAFAVALAARVGSARRITLNPAGWTTRPRLLDLCGRELRIDWFKAAAPDVVSVRRGYNRRLVISLVAPKASDPVAAAALPAGLTWV